VANSSTAIRRLVVGEPPLGRRGKVRVGLACALLCLAFSPPCASGSPAEDARRALDAGDFFLAVKLFAPLAQQGDAEAQFQLASLYDEGEGVIEDEQEALKWYRLAAAQGHASAQAALGAAYAAGRGVAQDHSEAARWDRLAAVQGHAQAQFNLAWLYHSGEGVPRDVERAYQWFDLAVEFATEGQRALYLEARNHAALDMTSTQIDRAHRSATACRESRFKVCG
jgi:hypothetical protein